MMNSKPNCHLGDQRRRASTGLTRIAVIVILAVLALLAAVVLPALLKARELARRIGCVNNLKNIGLGYRIFSTDHEGLLPWATPSTNGGSREWVADGNQTFRHWTALSNELSTTAILICPSDLDRRPAHFLWWHAAPPGWPATTNTSRISYGIGLNADEENSRTILALDRNVTTNGVPLGPGRWVVSTNQTVGFTSAIHEGAGNILMGDGSVQQATSARFDELAREAFRSAGVSTNTWLIP